MNGEFVMPTAAAATVHLYAQLSEAIRFQINVSLPVRAVTLFFIAPVTETHQFSNAPAAR